MNKNFSRLTGLLEFGLGMLNEPILSPLVDDNIAIKPGEQNATIKLAVPGFSSEDVKLTKKGDKLLVYLNKELVKSYFLTKSIDKDEIKAEVKNGILTINFEKSFEAEEEEIEIN